MKKKLMIAVTMGVMVLGMTAGVAYGAPAAAAGVETMAARGAGTEIRPMVDDIGWEYKVVDKKLYKRLYNYTTNKPLTDWEYVGTFD